MVDLKIEVPEDFYKEEVRLDYTIPEQMKKVWAVQIDLIKEFERMCDKYGLKYSVFAGTMLGAVRHKGFIPWDDDVDLVMSRADYDILLSHKDEFEHPYFLQTPYNDIGFFDNVVKFRNSSTTGVRWTDVYSKFNNGIFIDIFVMDDVPKNIFRRAFKYINCKFRAFWVYGFFHTLEFFQHLFKKKGKLPLPRVWMYRGLDRACAKRYKNKKRLMIYLYYSQLGQNVFACDAFDKVVDVPFEWTSVRMIGDFEPYLVAAYGNNWATPYMAKNMHGSVYFDVDTPYKEYLEKNY